MLLFSDSILPSHEGKQTSQKMLTIGSAPSSIPFILSIQKPTADLPWCDLPEAVAAVGDFVDPLRCWIHDCHTWSVVASVAHKSRLETFTRSFQAEASTVIYLLVCTVYVYKKQQCNNMYVLYCFICIRYIYLSESKWFSTTVWHLDNSSQTFTLMLCLRVELSTRTQKHAKAKVSSFHVSPAVSSRNDQHFALQSKDISSGRGNRTVRFSVGMALASALPSGPRPIASKVPGCDATNPKWSQMISGS